MLKSWTLFVIVCAATLTTYPQPAHHIVRSPRAEPLSFQEFFAPTPNTLQPSEKLLRLHEKQVRIVGFMAQMEDGPTGAFYLCARPVKCDESGAGIGDLPIASVLVIVPAMKGKKIPFLARALAVTGRLEIGNSSEAENATAPIRLILASPVPVTRRNSRHLQPKLTNFIYKRRTTL